MVRTDSCVGFPQLISFIQFCPSEVRSQEQVSDGSLKIKDTTHSSTISPFSLVQTIHAKMVLFRLEFLALAGLIASTVDGFAPAPTTPLIHGNHHTSGSALFVGPEHLESVQSLVTTATTTSNSLDSSDLMISLLTGEKLGELAKSIVIVLLFGGG